MADKKTKKKTKGRIKGQRPPFFKENHKQKGGFWPSRFPSLVTKTLGERGRERGGRPTDGEYRVGDGDGVLANQAPADPCNTTTESNRDGARVRKS